jgi:SNF2 family DNA or RNA helicase
MKIIASEDRFALANATDKDLLVAKEKCGFRFDPVTAMFTGNAENVDMLKNHRLLLRDPLTITDRAAAMYRDAGMKILTAVEQSHAKESDAVIPCPEGLAYLPFQRAGIAYAAPRRYTLVADEMGLGKTVQAVGICNALPDARRILVICPASLKHQWRREWKKWDVKGLSVEIIDGEEEYEFTANVVIINYDILAAHRSEIKDRGQWDLVCLDECHYLKSGRADRTLEVFGGIKRESDKTIKERFEPIPAKRMALLSGTPLVNKPKELWPLLRAIDGDGLGADWFHFARRYCEARSLDRFNPHTQKMERFGWDWSGAANLEELQEIMRSRFMVRRLKKDVLVDLPAKRRQVIVLEPKPQLAKLIAKETKTYEKYALDAAALEDLPTESPAFSEISALRKQIAIKKIPYVIEHIKEVLNETPKVVVFVHHHACADLLFEAFGNQAVQLDGRLSGEDRQHAVDRFQTDPSCRVFIGGIQSAGTGITLTAASVVVFAELSWVPAEISQAEDRCHRIGQKESVLVQHIVLEGSLDEHVVEILIKKQEILDKVLDAPNKGII